ncbi:MAG: MBL fold metallo-hydrolase [Desulfobacterales bacterium]|jgi:glyoxylase-like metal-dependent hydrolase (beta-lactamase superfamily II)
MIVRQLSVGYMDVFCYLVGCEDTRQAIVIDPGGDESKILERAQKDNLRIKYIVNTHHHWDHSSGNARLKEATGARLVMHALEDDILQGRGPWGSGTTSSPPADIRLETEKTLTVGNITFEIFFTPGHTPGGICLYADGQLFTGDTLFVGDSGRTDLPGGDRSAMGASIRNLMKLPDSTIVWPGHDYGPNPNSTIWREKRTNVNAKEYGYYVAD